LAFRGYLLVDRELSPTHELPRRYLPFTDSFHTMHVIPNQPTTGHYAFGDLVSYGPSAVFERLASIMGLDRPWSIAPNQACLFRKRVSPLSRERASLGLSLPQGFTHRWPWTIKPSPLRGSDLLRVLLPPEMASPQAERLPSWSLCLVT